MIRRTIQKQFADSFSNRSTVTLLYGPRQAGKTTLLREIIGGYNKEKIEYFSGDDLFVQETFSRHELKYLSKVVSGKDIIIVDEAQRIENIGLSAKLLVDTLSVKVVLSGSSSFELSNRVSEPLTGRTSTFHLHPLSWAEVSESFRTTRPEAALEDMLRYGMYPRVRTLTSDAERESYITEYLSNYLSKDILIFDDIRKPKKVIDLLTLLALQVGNEVSVAELSRHLSLSQPTVERYLNILEQMFVIVNVRGFSRNLRKEISKTSKYYFIDVGLRNAVIRNFNPLHLRNDAGALFENWFILERMKRLGNTGIPTNFYFWRTYDQQEIDLIEERGGELVAYECKYASGKTVKTPCDWSVAYPDARFVPVVGTDAFPLLDGEAE